MLFTGKNICKLDSKGRFSVPGAFLAGGRKFYFTTGLDGCLFLYPEKNWEKIYEKISLLNYSKSSNRKFLRIFFARAAQVSADSHNRLLIPLHLKEEAGIKREIFLIKIGGWSEIWEPLKFRKYEKFNQKTYAALAEKLDIEI
ncbi:MAG: hypothetical protein ABIJ15_05115 [bacterium]